MATRNKAMAMGALSAASAALLIPSSGATPTARAGGMPLSWMRCAAAVAPLQTRPYARRADLRSIPWIVATPPSVGITGHLFFATVPGTRFIHLGAHGTAAALYTGGKMPGRAAAAMKILWVFDNPRASDVLGPLAITGRNLTGAGTMHQIIPRAGGRGIDYPSIINIPMPGCWRLHLQIKSLAADKTTFQATVTMIVVGKDAGKQGAARS